MSREIAVIIRDDITGEVLSAEIAQPLYLGLEGVWWEIDTSPETWAKVHAQLMELVKHGQRIDEVPRPQERKVDSRRVLKASLRAFAEEQKYALAKRAGSYYYPVGLCTLYEVANNLPEGSVVRQIHPR